MLPKPRSKLGYNLSEIHKICLDRKIKLDHFWGSFEINTVSVGKDGKARYYPRDVETALNHMGFTDCVDNGWD